MSRRPKADIAARLLAWYDTHRRDLPWRYAPGVAADPYRVWLSEMMLQQTTVKAVVPYFERFTQRWPTVEALAAAALDDVLAAWAGLGYYARARSLHACAIVVAQRYAGRFPATESELLGLPGIGPYTAAAIVAIGHGLKATPVDGNIERVVSRVVRIEEPLPRSKPTLRRHAAAMTPDARAGDFAQAMMDLGATVCTPKSPTCLLCPLSVSCGAHKAGLAADLPRRLAKAPRPTRYGVAFVLVRADGAILFRRRPTSGLLGGMLEVPSTEWTETRPGHNAIRAAQPAAVAFTALDEPVVHVFTHFRLELAVHVARPGRHKAPDGLWLTPEETRGAALPSLMRHVLDAAGVTPTRTKARSRA